MHYPISRLGCKPANGVVGINVGGSYRRGYICYCANDMPQDSIKA